MKWLEIKNIKELSMFKSMIYMMILPTALCVLAGIVIAIVSIATERLELMIFSGILTIAYPVFFIVIYGVFGMLTALIYNLFARKFGGLVIQVEEKEN